MSYQRQYNELPLHMRIRTPILPSHSTQSRNSQVRHNARNPPRPAVVTSQYLRDDALPSPYNIIDMDPHGTTTTVIGELPEHMRASTPIFHSPTQAASRAIWGEPATTRTVTTTVTWDNRMSDHILAPPPTPIYQSPFEADARPFWHNATTTTQEDEQPGHTRDPTPFYYSPTEADARPFWHNETIEPAARRLVVTNDATSNAYAPDAPNEAPRRTPSTTLSPPHSPTEAEPNQQAQPQPQTDSQRPPHPDPDSTTPSPSPGRFYIDTGDVVQVDIRFDYEIDDVHPEYGRNVDVELGSYTRVEADVGGGGGGSGRRRRRLIATIRAFFRWPSGL